MSVFHHLDKIAVGAFYLCESLIMCLCRVCLWNVVYFIWTLSLLSFEINGRESYAPYAATEKKVYFLLCHK